MARTQRLPEQDEHSDEATLDLAPVSDATMERRRTFVRAAREIAARSPRPWDLDTAALLREDREG